MTVTPWFADVLERFHEAREQWDFDREEWSYGYATEMAEYEEYYPKPRLQDFMKHMSRAEQGYRCISCGGEGFVRRRRWRHVEPGPHDHVFVTDV